MKDENIKTDCPYCGQLMKNGYILLGGSVTFAESTVAFGPMFATKPDIERMLEGSETGPFHVIVGGKGYQLDPQNWPKPGMFCEHCLCLIVKIKIK